MGIRRFVPSPSMLVALVAVIIAVGGVAVAAIPGSGGTISACYANDDFVKQLVSPVDQFTEIATPAGSMRVVDEGDRCGGGETKLTFNQTGPAGPPGPAGPRGPVGRGSTNTNKNSVTLPGDKSTRVLSVKPNSPGRYLVIGNVIVNFTGEDPAQLPNFTDVSCEIPTAGGNRFAFAIADIPRRFYRTTLPLNAVITTKANNIIQIRCNPTTSKGDVVTAKASLTLLRVGD